MTSVISSWKLSDVIRARAPGSVASDGDSDVPSTLFATFCAWIIGLDGFDLESWMNMCHISAPLLHSQRSKKAEDQEGWATKQT